MAKHFLFDHNFGEPEFADRPRIGQKMPRRRCGREGARTGGQREGQKQLISQMQLDGRP